MPNLFWRLFNLARRWSEDRQAEPASLVPQMRALWKKSERRKVEYMNLKLVRSQSRKVA